MSEPTPRLLRVTPLGGLGEPVEVEPADPTVPVERDALVGGVEERPDGSVRVEVVVDGWRFELDVEDAARAALRRRARRDRAGAEHGGPLEVRAIIPGRVVAVNVAAGDRVAAGQPLLVVEAMKMQNELRAPRDGTVERIDVGPGRTIELGDLLLVLA